MKDLKIYGAIKNYAKNSPVRFHMPGHKGKKFIKIKPSLDVTELSRIDNANVVAAAERDCAALLGAKKVFFLSDGATVGVLSAIYATKVNGGKLLINRSAHKSVYSALKVFEIEPVILNGEITADAVRKVFSEDELVYAACFTYPDYLGRTFDLAAVKAECESFGKILITDSAHGNHFRYLGLPYSGRTADVSVESLHKTAYTFNQGAIICVNNESLYEKVSEAVKIFSTTSPSYPILASVEYGIKYGAANKKEYLKRAALALKAKEKLSASGLNVLPCADPFKIAVSFKKSGYDGIKAEKYLEKKKIFSEMYSESLILFMSSVATKKRDYKRLVKGLLGAVKAQKKLDCVEKDYEFPQRKIGYLDAVKNAELTPIFNAVGKICAENFGTVPPCEPAFVAGEVIDERINSVRGETFGVYEGKVKTVKEK